MSADDNLELVHRMYDALNAQDLEAHHEFWTEDMIWHGPPGFGDIHGVEGFKNEVLKPFYKAFPDYHVKNDIEVADENWIAATGFLTATHQGEWLNIAPTGKPVKMRFSDFWLVKEGRLSENWVMVDHIEVLRQLGIDPLAQIKG
jgi:predicted ester cyclase